MALYGLGHGPLIARPHPLLLLWGWGAPLAFSPYPLTRLGKPVDLVSWIPRKITEGGGSPGESHLGNQCPITHVRKYPGAG